MLVYSPIDLATHLPLMAVMLTSGCPSKIEQNLTLNNKIKVS